MSKSEVFSRVYDLVASVPLGKVTTYGDVAKIIDINPRYVGYILHHNPDQGVIPCHRVVNSRGEISANFAFGGPRAQQRLLEDEGIIFTDNMLDLSRYRHHF